MIGSRTPLGCLAAGAVCLLLLLVAAFGSARAGSLATLPACAGSVGDHTLGGPSNIGAAGEWLQGDGKTDLQLGCTYQAPDNNGLGGPEWEMHVAWITSANPGHEFYGCGARPADPTRTFVSAGHEAYAGVNRNDVPELTAAAKKLLTAAEPLSKPCAGVKPPPKTPPTTKKHPTAAKFRWALTGWEKSHGSTVDAYTYRIRGLGSFRAPTRGGAISKPTGTIRVTMYYPTKLHLNETWVLKILGGRYSKSGAVEEAHLDVDIIGADSSHCAADSEGVLTATDGGGGTASDEIDLRVCGAVLRFDTRTGTRIVGRTAVVIGELIAAR